MISARPRGVAFCGSPLFMPLAATGTQTTTHVRPGRACGNTARPMKPPAFTLVLVFMVVSSFPSKVRSLDNAQSAPEPAQLDLTCPAGRSYGFLKPLAFTFHRRHWGSLLVRGSSIFIERANAPPNYLVAAVCTSLRFRLHHAAMTSRKVLSCRTSPAAGCSMVVRRAGVRAVEVKSGTRSVAASAAGV